MSKQCCVWAVLLLGLLAGLAARTPPPSRKALNVLTLGDSNGIFPHSWPQQLGRALPNTRVFNLSKSGRTIGFVNNGDSSLNSLLVIDDNLRRAADFTRDWPYDYVVLALGTNDAKAVFANRQAEVPAHLEQLVRRIQGSPYPALARARLIIIAPPPQGRRAEATAKYQGGNQRVAQLSPAFREVAQRTHCLFVDGYHTPGLDIETMSPDGIHLDAAGSQKLIAPVVALLRQ
ncbi:hypothetical protein EJV47_07130 [Hymenobacter gummosus]|uniref:SGNH hydrolase-type esterase domain-containing protein n=1 Tax=Hymenobacter gummosus TaxID=1776032 RepID=A0A3S0JIV7_9BACT|nr:GDSL-type esterase/lipase family protein [Hymenobacter gummosus]RTQ51565.1 hypothetical protein EJV47_07130 [Hymenobacter gummosus]